MKSVLEKKKKKEEKGRGREERREEEEVTTQRKRNIVGLLVGMIFKTFKRSPAQAPCSENTI